ncbi:hypothetical protein H9L13_07060 [Sphingomonas lutea]|uniref:Uncharacterized protein n=1 Tax=Sphingomonas lutea TaxID=1045317 RepID=A0A7G9SF60_9SPHN|nr:hypothetical protein [Sphingomonas lutea]QNN66485.1 hypothetical protein H9L13_07060 [Sphingomonas lutea]
MQGALRRHVTKMERKELDTVIAARKQADLDAQNAYNAELEALLEKGKAARIPRIAFI